MREILEIIETFNIVVLVVVTQTHTFVKTQRIIPLKLMIFLVSKKLIRADLKKQNKKTPQ